MCGIIGVFNSDIASMEAYLGLSELQHRGQEGAGIVSHDGKNIHPFRSTGLVHEVFKKGKRARKLLGKIALGGNRYSTIDAYGLDTIQPLTFNWNETDFATVHNGNIANFGELKEEFEKKGSIFKTGIDSEIFAHLIARAKGESLQDKIENSFPRLTGAYSTIIMTGEELIAVRDPWGFRPFQLGKRNDTYILASETGALDLLKADYIREVKPGEILTINKYGLSSRQMKQEKSAFCVFEYVYFSRPDAFFNGSHIDKHRRKLGVQAAIEYSIDADMVIGVPDSGNTAALGYAQQSGIPFDMGLLRNHYGIGRTYITPGHELRIENIDKKLKPVPGLLKGKSVIMVDDSLVRGSTMRKIAGKLRDVGVAEIHVIISSPPIGYTCFYGNNHTQDNLFIHSTEIRNSPNVLRAAEKSLGIDSLNYLSLEGMLQSVPNNISYCTACFSGNYPTDIPITQVSAPTIK